MITKFKENVTFTFSTKPKSKKLGAELNFTDFNSIKISLASPEQVRSWSFGEVKKPETINYRTFRPERDGLFCERIFGPVRDWECNCGKYKYIKHKGIVCDRCGVEVIESKVRRERMGHIELAVPVAHVWFVRKPPSRIGMLLDMRVSDLEAVIYYAKYVVLEDLKDSQGKTILAKKQVIKDEDYKKYKSEYQAKFKADIGAKAINEILSSIDLATEEQEIRKRIVTVQAEGERNRLLRRLRMIDSFIRSGNKPEWMIFTVLPVLAPDLRPLVPLEGGRFASSDLNDLYRRIINRNNRLRHMMSLKAPEVMIHNEKRLLQEAVDALIENGARGKVVTGAGGRPLKSFSDILKGKQGRFRQNLLGKRVDYSGRSVVVVGPNLKLHQCGLPKEMALELFKPFILRELIKRGNVTLKAAKRMLERATTEVWDILDNITKRYPVLLNRAPTLHRLSIQAFEPVLIEGKAIQIHPMTCAAFNADFDGDQMAVHVPLSLEAQLEARLLMWAPYNILSPASGRPLATPSQDMVLGCCYLTKEKLGDLGEGKVFGSADDVIVAYQNNETSLHSRIKVRGITPLREPDLSDKEQRDVLKWKHYTTVGRVIFNEVLPKELKYINEEMTKKKMADLIDKCYHSLGLSKTVDLLDEIKKLGYNYATISGLSISVTDMKIPLLKKELIAQAQQEVKEIRRQAQVGAITDMERYNKIVDIWTHVTERVTENLFSEMRKDDKLPIEKGRSKFNSILMMATSGARGSQEQMRQLCGMRGLMTRPARKLTGEMGEIIESPVLSNFREGLTVLEYFISAHGGRKGLADTALKTADAGYLTRRLVDVAHDVVINIEDCGTINGVRVGTLRSGDEIIEPIGERIVGRIALDSIVGLLPGPTGELHEKQIIKAGDLITREQAKEVEQAGIDMIRIRSILTCEAPFGVCVKCYGLSMATGRLVNVGEAVGIIAAQSIGEPGTQLTLRTFHIGGTAARVVKRNSAKTSREGVVKFHNYKEDLLVKDREGQIINVNRNMVVGVVESGKGIESPRDYHQIPYGARIKVKENQHVASGKVLAEWDPHSLPIIAEYNGVLKLEDVEEGKTLQVEKDRVTGLVERKIIEHRVENLSPRVEILTDESFEFVEKILKKHLANKKKSKIYEKIEETSELNKSVMKDFKNSDIGGSAKERFSKNYRKLSRLFRDLLDEKNKEFVEEEKEELRKAFPPSYILPVDTHLVIDDLDKVKIGDIVAKTPIEVTKTKDITGGLPRVIELFEARKPKNPAIISEIGGIVHITTTAKGMLKVKITDEETRMSREYVIPLEKHLVVREGDEVSAGEPLTSGAVNSHDVLRVKQSKGLQEHLVNEIQEVYRLQGVMISDKHIEIIVRQMLSFVSVTESGDTGLLAGEIVKRSKFVDENKAVKSKKGREASAQPILLGLTRASLFSDSFISAASFQETTRILTESSLKGETDGLRGLKENVIIGHLIPAGTGLAEYRNILEGSGK